MHQPKFMFILTASSYAAQSNLKNTWKDFLEKFPHFSTPLPVKLEWIFSLG